MAGSGDGVGEAVAVGVIVAVAVIVAVTVIISVGVIVEVALGVIVAVGVAEGTAVFVAVAVGLGSGLPGGSSAMAWALQKSAAAITSSVTYGRNCDVFEWFNLFPGRGSSGAVWMFRPALNINRLALPNR